MRRNVSAWTVWRSPQSSDAWLRRCPSAWWSFSGCCGTSSMTSGCPSTPRRSSQSLARCCGASSAVVVYVWPLSAVYVSSVNNDDRKEHYMCCCTRCMKTSYQHLPPIEMWRNVFGFLFLSLLTMLSESVSAVLCISVHRSLWSSAWRPTLSDASWMRRSRRWARYARSSFGRSSSVRRPATRRGRLRFADHRGGRGGGPVPRAGAPEQWRRLRGQRCHVLRRRLLCIFVLVVLMMLSVVLLSVEEILWTCELVCSLQGGSLGLPPGPEARRCHGEPTEGRGRRGRSAVRRSAARQRHCAVSRSPWCEAASSSLARAAWSSS